MKEKYEAPELEVIDLGEDIITTSGNDVIDEPVPSFTVASGTAYYSK